MCHHSVICVIILLIKKLCVYRHVTFLERISFYSLSFNSHTPTKYELSHTNPFAFDDDIYSDCNIQSYRADTISTLDTNVPFVPTTIQQPFSIIYLILSITPLIFVITLMIVKLLNHLILFITCIPLLFPFCLSPISIKISLLILFNNKLWHRNLLLCIIKILGT